MTFIPSLLIVVSDIFELQDGSLHFSPAVPSAVIDREHLKAGDHVELRRPDGTTVRATLHGLDWFVPFNGEMGLSLNKPLRKTDIPVGTEIWKIG